MNDIIALKFHISLNATTWIGRIGMVVLPAIVYYIAYRWCVGLQRSDRAVLEHGIETGILKRLPHGAYIELHQPLGPVDDHGHPIPLEYQGAALPKKMNKLGSARRTGHRQLPVPPTRSPSTTRSPRPPTPPNTGRSPRCKEHQDDGTNGNGSNGTRLATGHGSNGNGNGSQRRTTRPRLTDAVSTHAAAATDWRVSVRRRDAAQLAQEEPRRAGIANA